MGFLYPSFGQPHFPPLPSQNKGSSAGPILTQPCLRPHDHSTGSVLEAAPFSARKKSFSDSAVQAERTLSVTFPFPGKLPFLSQGEKLAGTRVSTSKASQKLPWTCTCSYCGNGQE